MCNAVTGDWLMTVGSGVLIVIETLVVAFVDYYHYSVDCDSVNGITVVYNKTVTIEIH